MATERIAELIKTKYNTGRLKLHTTAMILNKAILGTIAMKAVTTRGAPSYKSGAHMWNGDAAILISKATTIKIHRLLAKPVANGSCHSSHKDRLVVPVSPKRRDVPNRWNNGILGCFTCPIRDEATASNLVPSTHGILVTNVQPR